MRSDLQKYTPWQAGVIVLREAIEYGLVNSSIGQRDYPSLITPAAIDYCEEVFNQTGTKNSADLENAGTSPKSIHFRSDSRGVVVHPETTAPYSAWSVELARFAVPLGYVGVIKGFEQYLAQLEEGQNPAFVYTSNARWGIPGPYHTGIANPVSDAGKWHFRLRTWGKTVPNWWDLIGAGTLPDLPYTDFANESGLWWPAGSAASQNTHMLVPGGHLLRVFYTTPAQAVRLEVASRIKGFVQSDRNPETAYNIRTHW